MWILVLCQFMVIIPHYDPNLIKITYGKSKDGRNDLKQFMISMVTSNRIPVFMKLINGNTSDKTHFRELVNEFGQNILDMFDTTKFFVFDTLTIYSVKHNEKIVYEKIPNLKSNQIHVLRLMGEYIKMYEINGEYLNVLLGKLLDDKIK